VTGGVRVVTFEESDLGPVLAHLEGLHREGRGWVNVRPDVDAPPPSRGLSLVFSARGPAVPLGTWVAPAPTRRGERGPATIGLEHGLGAKAMPHLRAAGLEPPAGWRVRQDHVRRGLVVEVDDATAPDAALRWLLAAARSLCRLPLGQAWVASVHEG
jgi:hypothetical protein